MSEVFVSIMMGVFIGICGLSNVTKVLNILGMVKRIISSVLRWLAGLIKYFFCVILMFPFRLLHRHVIIPVWEVLCAVNGLTFNLKECCNSLYDRVYRRYNPYDALEAV